MALDRATESPKRRVRELSLAAERRDIQGMTLQRQEQRMKSFLLQGMFQTRRRLRLRIHLHKRDGFHHLIVVVEKMMKKKKKKTGIVQILMKLKHMREEHHHFLNC